MSKILRKKRDNPYLTIDKTALNDKRLTWQAKGLHAYLMGLPDDWREDLKQGIRECFRVLKPNGTFVFKWNETQVPTRELMALFPYKPLIGHQSGKRSNTHWMVFLKEAA